MNLVQFLAAGCNGAEGGTATFLLRGTASSAAAVLYEQFEGLTQPGTNVISLDSNGAAEIYCDAYCDVVISNSAGVPLRTVTIGHSAPLVEVQSQSFTGTDYDGNPANTAGEPVDLKTVLDRWFTSAGTTDFKVLIGGVATDLDTAFAAGLTGVVFNVKDPAYGATGDGVTDDTTAILAANTAANGGPVFFPAGTYKMTTATLSGANINWFGAGAGASIISGISSTNLIALSDNTSTGWKNFRNLSFTSSGAYTRLFALEESQNTTFRNCVFDASQCSGDAVELNAAAGLSKVVVTDCDFTLGASTGTAIQNSAATGRRSITVTGTSFTVPSGFTGRVLRGPDFNVRGCRFDGSAVDAGTYRWVDAEDLSSVGKYVGNFVGNKFIDGGSEGFVFELTSIGSECDFVEDSNIFIGYTVPSATEETGQTYEITGSESGIPGNIHLGSRKGRTIYLENDQTTFEIGACLEAEHVVIDHDGSSNVEFTIPPLIPGLSGDVVVYLVEPNSTITVSFRGGPFDGISTASIETTTTLDPKEEMVASLPDGFSCSAGYFTSCMSAGDYRSFITRVTGHDFSV